MTSEMSKLTSEATTATRKGNERLKKEIQDIFKEEGLRITIYPNKNVYVFL